MTITVTASQKQVEFVNNAVKKAEEVEKKVVRTTGYVAGKTAKHGLGLWAEFKAGYEEGIK